MYYKHLHKNLFFVENGKNLYLIQTYPFKIFSIKDRKQLNSIKNELIQKNYKTDFKRISYKNYFSLEFILTSMCNLDCKYCYAKREDSGYYGLTKMHMSKKTAKKAIDFSINEIISSVKNKEERYILDVYFMGGEPLMNKKTLFFCMNYLEKQIKKLEGENVKIDLQAAISTNGTLIDDEISKFFKKFNFNYVGITIDGEKHDEYRVYDDNKGTLSDIKKAIKVLDRNNINLKLLSVVPPGDVNKIDDILAFYKREGFLDSAFRVSIVPRAPSLNELNRSCVIPKKFLEKQIEKNEKINYTKKERKTFSDKIIEISKKFNIDERDIRKKMIDAIRMGGFSQRCPAGICKISVTPEGSIYPCHQLIGVDKFYMGSLNKFEKTRYEKIKQIFIDRTVFKLDKCKKCLFQTLCPPLVDCPARSFHEEKNFYKTSQYCDMYYDYIKDIFEDFMNTDMR